MSFNVAMLEAMQAEGLDLDACIRVLRAGEMRADPTAAERKRRQRERDKSRCDVTRDSSSPLVPPLKAPPDPQKITPPITPHLNGSTSSDVDAQVAEIVLPEHVADEWNTVAARLGKPRVRDITPARRVTIKARVADYSIDDFVDVFGKVERSAFLRGDTGWPGCTFDWIMKKANFQKVLEGNYDN